MLNVNNITTNKSNYRIGFPSGAQFFCSVEDVESEKGARMKLFLYNVACLYICLRGYIFCSI